MQNKQIDIVIPFYNTANHIFELLRENITALLRENRLQNFSITLVNDGSTKDNYKSYIIALLSDFPHCVNFLNLEQNRGKGGAIKEGIKQSTAPLVVFYDIDFPFGRNALYSIIENLQKSDNDICIAKRDESYNKKLPWKRKIISQGVKKIIWILSKGKITDSQAGLKAMKRDATSILLCTECNSFIMDFEFLLKLIKHNKKIGEIIVTPNENIEFTDFSTNTIAKEIKSLFKILVS
ncbi:glycosyltransferase [Capnocytophaga canis]|uniref:glycosyltransferase n=1 Tax=Capnocytophaga TaxID=1016 RepID=UPI000BB1E943|nr:MULTISPECIES: glycosyltransferase [Capnocytophaga]ATA73286.1 hypothetical protein CGC49_08375 [Capnocytophaga sp. H4358]GIM60458.1 hypothetical protein CAPN008_05080 [Capnocytophaga canis]